MTDDEANAALSVAAIAVNRFYVHATDTHTRIAFAEVVDGKINYRLAVLVPNSDADELAELIERLQAKRRKKPKA